MQRTLLMIACICMALRSLAAVTGMQAGVGRAVITPDTQPVWLAGYAARTTPATGMLHHVWAKALAIEDGDGKRAVIITADVLGLTRELTTIICAQLAAKHGLTRQQIFFNASHTHSGPVVWPSLSVCCAFTPQDQQHVVTQNRMLAERMVMAVDHAVATLAPAELSFGYGTAGFAINRRKRDIAPVDHTVPVLRVSAPDGTVRAILFNYACHGTTLQGNNLLINGDYAGFAMLELERAYPGATALFVQGCAGDQGPEPRGTVAHAAAYGKTLAEAVERVLAQEMKSVAGALRTAFTETRLSFRPVGLDVFRAELTGSNPFRQRRAERVLYAFNAGSPMTDIPYPVQALRMGETTVFIFLSGEIVVDYARRIRRDYPHPDLLVAGYCNEVQSYIPSLRVLREGGYEADDSMIYYGLPGPFTDAVEASVLDAVATVCRQLGLTPTSRGE
jgi:hypothetical protein